MKMRRAMLPVLLVVGELCFAGANGKWLQKVPAKERVRLNPYANNTAAAEAGAILFHNNCARCHGPDARGKGARPSLRSQRVETASDGELAWLLKNGEPYKGMPSWSGLPVQERWQIITYLRTLNAAAAEEQK